MGQQRKLKESEDYDQTAEYLKSRLEKGTLRQRQKNENKNVCLVGCRAIRHSVCFDLFPRQDSWDPKNV